MALQLKPRTTSWWEGGSVAQRLRRGRRVGASPERPPKRVAFVAGLAVAIVLAGSVGAYGFDRAERSNFLPGTRIGGVAVAVVAKGEQPAIECVGLADRASGRVLGPESELPGHRAGLEPLGVGRHQERRDPLRARPTGAGELQRLLRAAIGEALPARSHQVNVMPVLKMLTT